MNKFEEAIKAYLDKRASEDALFAQSYAKESKNITECCKFIIGEASKVSDGGSAVMSDEEVYGLAVHYYDEDDIEITEVKGADVRPPHNGATYEPTEEDKENARKAALKRLEDEAFQKYHTPRKKKAEEQAPVEQPTLFDML